MSQNDHKWILSEAKARFSEVVGNCSNEPQVLLNRKKPVAVILDFEQYKRYKAMEEPTEKEVMKDLLGELKKLNEEEDDLMLPPRADRPAVELD